MDYLRSALTVLVVAHHASLAYTTFATFDKTAYINSTHPIVDTRRWIGLDIFENFNDIFFMSLMFLIGGLFLSKSIERKGAAHFVKDRFYRLFLPFILGGTALMLLAYFPSFYLAHSSTNIKAYVVDFFTVEQWPVGPPWFIWVLFVFNLLLLLFHPLIRRSQAKLESFFRFFHAKPFLFWLVFYAFTWLLYVPLAYRIGANTWTGLGPFDFQVSRAPWYFGYFMLGVLIGNTNFNQGIFAEDGVLVKNWRGWIVLAVVAYTLISVNSVYQPLAKMVQAQQLPAFSAWMIYYSIYVASATFSCLAFITAFRSQIGKVIPWWDNLAENAYMIYLLHYVFITWIQFALLDVNLPAGLKFLLTFILSLALSWTLSAWLRRINWVKKYL